MRAYFAFLTMAVFWGGCIYRHEESSSDYDSGSRAGTCVGGTTGSRAGSSAGGAGSGGNTASGGSGTGGSETGGAAGQPEPEPEPEPEPPPPPACLELEDEASCSARGDCEPVYAGTDCSCGAECICEGGDPGCVCESYGFLVCWDAE